MKPVIAIVGPTAVGKTALSFFLAEEFHSELVSCDAYQIYRGMDIGTAKPTQEELSAYRHHLINIAAADEPFSAARFCALAQAEIAALHERGKLPIIVGGTGLYLQSLLEGYEFTAPRVLPHERERAARTVASMTPAELKSYITAATDWQPDDWHELLANRQRLIRLVAAVGRGEGAAFVRAGKASALIYDAFVIGLSLPRPVLYERIEKRIDAMLRAGWIEETAALLKEGLTESDQGMKAIGYGEIAAYLDGRITYDAMTAAIKTRTRRFAKRQLTWYRRMPYIHWYEKEKYDSEAALARTVIADIRGAGIGI
ncbi:tRNA (adenosine(37)-N6)-dimethylallyltransferase MiaA [Megasphaera vaginalis (ex Bordigoni et al. 2020)]|uniref:tRNA (adenosine(37)-N6)-dimethylallyltransferase MiaA n=1 Tax=Megasphaera vaginalis (ex Bordigoni et al. 2020) TaxID=2045301 RepID=UPI000C7A40BF|nr:tRNA (adenosine(37)-N6)-dimethylallyltransferase MiaA [Megasphaera vaginalis (ex Bordigoni et al. 2020)]